MGDPEIVGDGFRPLDPRLIPAERMTWWIALAIFTIVMGVACPLLVMSERVPRWFEIAVIAVALALIALQVLAAVVWPPISYRHASFRIDERGIEIRRGVWFRKVINVPRSRVQHTDVTQGPIERRYGLGTLVVYTAGTQYAMVGLSGLEYQMALWARDSLLPRRDGDDRESV